MDHATLPRGSCNEEDYITPGCAAVRDFNLAYVCSGSKAADRIAALASGYVQLTDIITAKNP